MKLYAFLIFALAVTTANAYEVPKFGALPKFHDPRGEWTVSDEGSSWNSMWWVIFENESKDEVIAVRVEKYDKDVPPAYEGGPWTEWSISYFSGGYPKRKQSDDDIRTKFSIPWGEADTVEFPGGTPAVKTLVYWEEESGAMHLAHGYAFAIGKFRVYVQHTSKKVVTPETVFEFAENIVRDRLPD